jgi:hypothetical protein
MYVSFSLRIPLHSLSCQLPTLYFAVLMLAHMVDHFVFTSRRLSEKTKWISFGVSAAAIVLTFWWWKGVAFGIDGPINEHWGLQWRKVSLPLGDEGIQNADGFFPVVEHI